MRKISKLTEEQEKRLAEVRAEWLAIGYSTAPLQREEGAKIIGEFYSRIGKAKPTVLFFSSPLMCILAWAALKGLTKENEKLQSPLVSELGSQLGPPLWSELGSQLWSSLQSQLESQIWSQLGPPLWSELGLPLESQLQSQIWSQLGPPLWSELGSQLESQLQSQIWSQIWSPLESQLQSQVQSPLQSQLWSQLGPPLWSELGSPLESQLQSQVQSPLESQLRSQIGSQIGAQLQSQIYAMIGGAHWCAWEVFYGFAEEIGVEYPKKDSDLLDLWLRQSRDLHWWFPYEGITFASERYTICKIDAQSRLHNPTGPAIQYSDGWGIWAWHGVRVEQRIIEQPESMSAKEILAEPNAEVRRVMIERVGVERFLSEAGAKCIHKHERGELFSIDLPGDPEGVLRSVRVIDPSTGRTYFLRVPPTITRADDAIAWTFGFDVAKEYQPLQET